MKTKLFAILGLVLAMGITACNDTPATTSKNSSQEQQSSNSAEASSSSDETSSSQASSFFSSLISSSQASSSSQTTSSSQKSSSSEQKSSSSQASSSSAASSSSQASSSSVHVHNYGTLNEGYLPSYFYDGMKPYYYCIECGQYFDINKNPTTQDALKLEKAGDSIALLLDGNEKETFELVEKDDNHASWKITNRGVSKGSVVSIAKPGDTTYKYGFHAGNNIDENYKILIDGQVDFLLDATPNGFYLSIAENSGIVVRVNGTDYPMHKTTYYQSTVTTYIYGYHKLVKDDKLTVVDINSNIVYDYDDLEDYTKWNKYDFHKGSNDEVVFDLNGRYGIEFDRNGDKKISITKTFAPATVGEVEVHFSGEKEPIALLSETYTPDSEAYKEITWYIMHENVINADDIKESIVNGVTFYQNTISFEENDAFSIDSKNPDLSIAGHHLVSVSASENSIDLNLGNIVIKKAGTYSIGYLPCCNSIFITAISQQTADAYIMVGGATSPLTKDDNGAVSYTGHFEKNDYVAFIDNAYQTITFDQVTISYGTPARVSSNTLVYFDKAGTYSLTLNLETKHLSVDAVELDPEETPAEITGAYLIGSGGMSARMVNNPNNADELMKENAEMKATSGGTVYVTVYKEDLSGYLEGVTLSPDSEDVAVSVTAGSTTMFYLTAGPGTYSFYLNKKTLVLRIVKVS